VKGTDRGFNIGFRDTKKPRNDPVSLRIIGQADPVELSDPYVVGTPTRVVIGADAKWRQVASKGGRIGHQQDTASVEEDRLDPEAPAVGHHR
jgi:hypothetical protein